MSLALEIVLLTMIKPWVSDFEAVAIIAVFAHALVVMAILGGWKNRLNTIVLLGFVARLLFLAWDAYARDIYIFPNSGSDTKLYWANAFLVAQDLSYLGESLRGGMFSKIMGVVFNMIGPQGLFGQYINLLFGLSVVVIIYNSLSLLKIKSSTTKTIVILAAFFPNSLVMSVVFLREITPTFFVAWSLLYFLRWYRLGHTRNMVLSLLMLAFASIFHSGVIGIFVGYAFMFLFYKRERNTFSFSGHTILSFIILASIVYLATVQYSELLFGKFTGVEDVDDVLETTNRRLGGSAYLTGLEINNPIQLVLYGPIRAFYFLTSPLPWNWRSGMDIFTFLSDSMLYLFTMYYFIRNRKLFGERGPLITGLVLALIGVGLVFGIGVANTGTAIRHRQKFIPLFLILLGLMMDAKKRSKKLIFSKKIATNLSKQA